MRMAAALLTPKRAVCLLAPLLCSALLIAGCRDPEPRADIVIINTAEPESIDPAIIRGQPDGRVAMSLFEGLTRFDPKTAQPIPGLAERWTISDDGRTYTFFLRSNLFWSTGEPITAHDFIYSWRRVIDPDTAADYASQLFFVKNGEAISRREMEPAELGIDAPDTRTLRVELVAPTAFFPDVCAFRTLAAVPRQTIEKHGDRWLMSKPLPTSGPYTLVSWRLGEKIRVRRNPRYWDATNVLNEVIDFLPIESPSAALNLYETGQADVILDRALIPAELMDIFRKRPDCHRFDYNATYFARFNVTRKPFDDPRVRKALALAVDKNRIVERITRAGEKPASVFTPPGVPNYTAPPGLDYNPERARQLLAEAGYPGGQGFRTFDYLFNTSEQNKQIGVELQSMWKKELGITMELRQTEWKVYLAAQGSLDYDLSRSSWVGDYNDANTFLDMFMSNNGNNRTGWKNSRYDALIREGNMQTDLARRAAILAQAEKLLIADELPILPIYFYVGVNIFDGTKIGGIHGNALDLHPVWSMFRKDKPLMAGRRD